MNLLIVNGYDKNGWGQLARYGLQPICEFYRDQLKIINSKIKTTFIYPSMNLDENYDESLRTLSLAKYEIDAFFENVIVNDNDPTIKKNRLELLKMLCKSFENYFNFSKIEA